MFSFIHMKETHRGMVMRRAIILTLRGGSIFEYWYDRKQDVRKVYIG